MKKFIPFFFLISFVVSSISAQEKGPIAISPASDAGIAKVGERCPTFSWTGMEWATGYKVVVFETNGPNVLAYKEMAAIASPILSKEINGRALSWTPSSDERLSNGSMYVWYVQAVDGYGTGIWSVGRMFKVEAGVQLVGMEEAVEESLKEHGVSDEVIEDVLEDMRVGMKEIVAYGVDTQVDKVGALDKVGIQGTEGTYNTFYGLNAGFNTTGYYNSFFGRAAGYSNSTGYANTFMGDAAGYTNTTGYENTFIGHYAGYANTTGFDNTFMGYMSGYANTTGNHNTFIGYYAGNYNTTGYSNTFIGYGAGYNNTTGYYNTFIGDYAGLFNTVGFVNTFMGYYAGFSNTSGGANTFMGDYAGYTNTTGNYNTYMGYNTGWSNSTGNGNVFLGYSAGFFETGSNKLYIDNSNTNNPLVWGNFNTNILTVHGKFAVGTKSPAYAMELETTGENAAFVAQRTDGATNYINATAGFGNFGTVTNHPLRLAVNSVWRMRLDSDNSLTMANGAVCTAGGTWQNYSRREAKENIHDLTAEEAMDTLWGLVAVKYNYKVDKEEKHVGFIAEDVPELVASKDRNGISAMDIVAVLTKVLQEQQKRDKEQQKIIDKLLERISELERKSR